MVDAARGVDAPRYLVDVDTDFLYLRCHGFYVGVVYLNDVPVDCHFPKIGCVIVKDLSRLGRNAIDTGYYIERYFPSHNVRFISVTDQFDSENADNLHGGIILPLKNMINEAYALDIGRKIKAQARQDNQEDGTIKSLTPRQVADLLGHSTSQITELYYVKKDTSRLSGITNDFNL